MSALTQLTLKAAIAGLKAKEFSAVEITKAHIDAIEAARGLNAYVLETPDQALTMAKASDERLARGEGGDLEGAPLGIKDLFCTQGVRSTAASKILGNFVPTYESTVTSKLWAQGAVMLGKLNLDEFAMGSSYETSAFGPSLAPGGRDDSPDARRLFGRFGGGDGGRPLPGRNCDRYRRLDPPARGLYRHGRDQADLWPLFALGYCRLCLVAGSGRTDRQDGGGRGHHAARHERS